MILYDVGTYDKLAQQNLATNSGDYSGQIYNVPTARNALKFAKMHVQRA